MLEGAIVEARMAREEVDPWWSERLGIEGFSPRYLLQKLGTEVMRHNFHPDIWVLATERRILDMEKEFDRLTSGTMKPNFVISDVRFPNEMAMIRRNGGQIWHVQRGELPDWFGKNPADIHESEKAWNNEQFDYTLRNDKDITGLCMAVDNLLKR
jgi:hypothetical protein